jgi:hypothetical protein
MRRWFFRSPDGDGAGGGGGGDGTPPAGDGTPPPKTDGQGTPPGTLVTPPTNGGAAGGEKKVGTLTVPEKYTLALGETSVLDKAILTEVETTARQLGLDNAGAQSMLTFLDGKVAAHIEATLANAKPGGAEWTKNVESWEAQALADADLGGSPDKLKVNAQKAAKVLATYFPPAVHTFLHETGFGSHPEVLRGLLKIAAATAEGDFVKPGDAPTTKPSVAELFYGKTEAEASA